MDTHRRRRRSALTGAAVLVAALTVGGCAVVDGLLGSGEEKSWGSQPIDSEPDQGETGSADIGDASEEAAEANATAGDGGDESTGTDEVTAKDDETLGGEDSGASETDDPDQESEVFVAQLQMPDQPAEMDRVDEHGAAAAAEYFLYAYTYAYGTGDTGPLLAMSGPDCGFCASVADAVAQAHDDGNYLRSPDPLIGAITSVASDAAEIDFLVQVEVQMPQMLTYDASDQVTGSVPAQDLLASFGLAQIDGDWLVIGAGLEAA